MTIHDLLTPFVFKLENRTSNDEKCRISPSLVDEVNYGNVLGVWANCCLENTNISETYTQWLNKNPLIGKIEIFTDKIQDIIKPIQFIQKSKKDDGSLLTKQLHPALNGGPFGLIELFPYACFYFTKNTELIFSLIKQTTTTVRLWPVNNFHL